MKLVRATVDRWLFTEYSYDAESLAIYRVLFCIYVIAVTLPAGLWIRELPAASFCPPLGLAALFQHYPSYGVMLGLNALTLAAACATLVGIQTPLASVVFAVAFVLVRTFCFADGKIDHDILLPITALLLGFAGWGNAYSLDVLMQKRRWGAPTELRPWLLAVFALVIGLALFTAGAAKLLGGWLDLARPATRWQLLSNYYVVERKPEMARWALMHFPTAVWKVGDVATVLWEMGVVFTVLRRKWFCTACALGCFFHFGVWRIFSITFGNNVMAYAAFVPYGSVLFRGRPFSPSLQRAFLTSAGVLSVAVAAVSLSVFGRNIGEALELPIDEAIVVAGLLGAVIYFIRTNARQSPPLRSR
jgi:Vitamin K-dependent gamma-carboxylase